jgi:hypothetical protein
MMAAAHLQMALQVCVPKTIALVVGQQIGSFVGMK